MTCVTDDGEQAADREIDVIGVFRYRNMYLLLPLLSSLFLIFFPFSSNSPF